MNRDRQAIGLAMVLLIRAGLPAFGGEPCDPIRTFADGQRPRREIFVSNSLGAGERQGDGSRAKPYASVALALKMALPGDAIRLLPGKYPGGIAAADLRGSKTAPIWIGGVPGEERPVIEGGSGGMHLTRVRYLVLENLEVAGARGNGINCDDGGDFANSNATRLVVFRGLSIHDIGTGGNNDGLKLSGVNDFFVLDCHFARISAGGSAIDQVGCRDGIIAGCFFADCGNAVQCKGGSENIEIRGSRFRGPGGRAINAGGSTGFALFRPPLSRNAPNFEARNIRVFANVFEGFEAPVAFVGAVDSIVANNTLIDPARWVVRILQETTSRDGYQFLPSGRDEFSNNLVWYASGAIRSHVNVGANTDPASFTFSHNLWYAHDQPARSKPRLPVAETGGVAGLDPQFKNALEPDYTLAAESPAAGKGKKIPSLKADGSGRCFADPPSIGAFELR